MANQPGTDYRMARSYQRVAQVVRNEPKPDPNYRMARSYQRVYSDPNATFGAWSYR